MFVIHHWETVPRDYFIAFETLDEAIEYVNEFDENDEWMIAELDERR